MKEKRIGQYFDWQFLPTTKFYAKNEFVQSVENKDDWWSSSGVGLRQNITKTVSFNFDWLNIYDNTPGEGNKRSDTTILAL